MARSFQTAMPQWKNCWWKSGSGLASCLPSLPELHTPSGKLPQLMGIHEVRSVMREPLPHVE